MSRRRIVVVGGGAAGLAATHRVIERGAAAADVILLESSPHLGGVMATEHTGGFTVETGPDSFITEKPWALSLCERLGIADRLIGTAEGDRRSYVAHRGRLLPLPEGFLLLAPTDLTALARSPLFSWPGKLRMALDLVLPRGPGGDETLAAFVRRRLGHEALERAAEPLVGGIYTSDAETLSLAATMPRFLDLERRYRSLILGLRAASRTTPTARGAAGARYGLFMSHRDGMGGLARDLVGRLPEGIARVGSGVTSLGRDGAAWRLRAGREVLAADAVVLATPAYASAALLRPTDPRLAERLDTIEYASSATVILGYRAADVRLAGFGFVVPAVAGRRLLACSYTSRKFPGRAPAGHELLRAFVGGARRPDLLELDDAVLLAAVREELADLLGITADPVLVRIVRHRRAMPQYRVGHLDLVTEIEGQAAAVGNLALAGAAYRGIGIPDCVHSGEVAADGLLAAG